MGYVEYAREQAEAAGIDPELFLRQIEQESGFDPNALSSAGAQGIAQFMPATAAGLGVDPWDPYDALAGAARLMRSHLDRFGSYALALAAYNAGAGAVEKYGGIPPYEETRHYVASILGDEPAPVPPH